MNGRTLEVSANTAIARTREWVEKVVIGLNLCPFAAPVHLSGRIHFAASAARSEDDLVGDLAREISALMAADAQRVETTLLIHPHVLNDFLDYNDFLDLADATVEALGFEGELQVASFHPDYRFAGTTDADIENYTNRSPYPTLHLLREESIERAVASVPDTDAIFEKNIETLRRLGLAGWQKLWTGGGEPDADK
jgi:hypothetical protein